MAFIQKEFPINQVAELAYYPGYQRNRYLHSEIDLVFFFLNCFFNRRYKITCSGKIAVLLISVFIFSIDLEGDFFVRFC